MIRFKEIDNRFAPSHAQPVRGIADIHSILLGTQLLSEVALLCQFELLRN